MSRSPASRPSWRQGTRPTAGPASRASGRWFFTLLTVGLLAFFAWILTQVNWHRAASVQMVTIVGGAYRNLAVRPLWLAAHDLRATLSGASAAGSPVAPASPTPDPSAAASPWPDHLKVQDWSDLLEGARPDPLRGRLATQNWSAEDSLVIYVHAHGVTLPSGPTAGSGVTRPPEILCRDFDLRDGLGARWSLADLLRETSAAPAKHKLLILDVCHAAPDPRLGMLVHEFPQQVAQIVQTHPDANLWVCLSTAPGQVTAARPQQPGTWFSHYLVRGLRGEADARENGGNGDRNLTLQELFAFVARGCDTATSGTQTPVLLQAGPPASAPPDSAHVTLARLSDTDSPLRRLFRRRGTSAAPEKGSAANDTPPASASAASPTPPAPDAPTPANTSASASATTATAPTPTSATAAAAPSPTSASSVNAASATNGAAPTIRQQLDAMWTLHAQLSDPNVVDEKWSPVDFAPQWWRELTALMVNFESLAYAAPEAEWRDLQLQVDKHWQGLRALSDPSAAGTIANRSGDLVVDRLLRSSDAFSRDPARQSFEQAVPALRPAGVWLRRVRRSAYHLVDYLAWYREASAVAADKDATLDEIGEGLAQWLQQIELFSQDVAEATRAPLAASELATWRDRHDDILAAEQRVVEGVERRWQEQLSHAHDPLHQRQLVVMLDSPLPSLTMRTAARQALSAAPAPPARSAGQPEPAAAQRNLAPPSTAHLRRTERSSDLLLRLLQLVRGADVSAPRVSGSTDPQVWARPFDGPALQIQQLEEQLAHEPPLQEPSFVAAVAVDPRDAPRIRDLHWGFARLTLVPPPVRADWSAIWETSPPFALSLERSTPATLIIRHTLTKPQTLEWSLEFDDKTIGVTRAGTDDRLTSKEFVPLAIEGPGEVRIELALQALRAVTPDDTRTTSPLVATLRTPELGSRSLPGVCSLPQPDQIELIVQEAPSGAEATRIGSEIIELRPFANRATRYQWAVRNLSGRARSVNVRLIAIPRQDSVAGPPGRVEGPDGRPDERHHEALWDAQREALRATRIPLAATATPVSLDASDSPVPLNLVVPPTTPPTPPTGDAAASPPAVVTGHDISYGLVCLIEDSAEPQKRWWQWLQLRPQSPRDYLHADVRYDLQRLEVAIGPRAGYRLPEGLAEVPLSISWDVSRLVQDQLVLGDRVETDVIQQANNPARLYVDVESSRTRTADIRLDVDRFPRAFLFDIPLDRRGEYPDPRRDQPELFIEAIELEGHPRVYVTAATTAERLKQPEDKREFIVLQRLDRAALPVPKPGQMLRIHWRADAPFAAFGPDDEQDVIELTFRDQRGDAVMDPLRRYADRQMTFQWQSSGTTNEFTIQTTVQDYVEGLIPPRLEGEFRLTATMYLTGRVEREYAVPIVFDSQPPKIVQPLQLVRQEVEAGQAAELTLRVEDRSGVASIDYGLVKRPQDPLDDATKQTLDARGQSAFRWKLPTEEPGEYHVAVVLRDRAGNTLTSRPNTDLAPLSLRVIKPKKPTKTPAGPVVGKVFGVVQAGETYFPDRITVKLTGGPPIPEVKTADGGKFEFANVPAGEYTLEAEGYAREPKEGKLPIKLQTAKDYLQPFVIPLKRAEEKDEPAP